MDSWILKQLKVKRHTLYTMRGEHFITLRSDTKRGITVLLTSEEENWEPPEVKKFALGLVLWHRELRWHLHCQHPIQVLV